MKNALILATACFAAWFTQAQAAEGKPLSPEQEQSRNAIIQKYDSNKDGVLDKSELKSLSKADKKALARTGGVGTAKKSATGKEGDVEKEKKDAQEKTEKAEKKSEEAQSAAKGGKSKHR